VNLKAGVEYLVVVRSTPRPAATSASACNVCTYSAHPLGLRLTEANKDARWAAFQASAYKHGDILWEENGAVVRTWTTEHGDFFVIVFDAGRSKLLASFEWTVSNMLVHESCPLEPSEKLVAAAASESSYTHEQVVELGPGQRQMTVLSWVQPRASYDLQYSYCCGSKSPVRSAACLLGSKYLAVSVATISFCSHPSCLVLLGSVMKSLCMKNARA